MKHFISLVGLFILGACGVNHFQVGSPVRNEFQDTLAVDHWMNLLIVPVEIDGQTYRFLFDTGAPNVISEELQSVLKLDTVTDINVRDSQEQRQRLSVVKIPLLTLGKTEFKDYSAIVGDLRGVPEIQCMNIDGILGANVMKDAFWIVDGSRNQIVFGSEKNWDIHDSSSITLPFRPKASGTPAVDIEINGKTVSNTTFDTGSNSFLSVPASIFPDMDSLPNLQIHGHLGSGLFGSVHDTDHYIPGVLSLSGMIVDSGIVRVKSNEGKGILGMEYLGQHRMYLDWKERNIVLERTQPSDPMRFYSFGMGLRWEDGKLLVANILQGSLADQYGVKVGDWILRFNNMDVSSTSQEEYCQWISWWSAQKSVRISIAQSAKLDLEKQLMFQKAPTP